MKNETQDGSRREIVIRIPITLGLPKGRRAAGLAAAVVLPLLVLASGRVLSDPPACVEAPDDVLCVFMPNAPARASAVNANFSKLNGRLGTAETELAAHDHPDLSAAIDLKLDAADWSSDGITYTSPYSGTIKYKKLGDVVFLSGHVNGGSNRIQKGDLFTLPAGIRPPTGTSVGLLLPTWGWGQDSNGAYLPAGVNIGATGVFRVQNLQSTGEQFLNVHGVSFRTD